MAEAVINIINEVIQICTSIKGIKTNLNILVDNFNGKKIKKTNTAELSGDAS